MGEKRDFHVISASRYEEISIDSYTETEFRELLAANAISVTESTIVVRGEIVELVQRTTTTTHLKSEAP